MNNSSISPMLAILFLALAFMACNSRESNRSLSTEMKGKDSVAADINPAVNWTDSVSMEMLKATKANRYGVKVIAGGTHYDIIYFIRNDSILAVDPIRNGNYLGVRGDGNDEYRKYWVGTGWKDCRLFPCTGMDITTVELPNGITLAAVRHGHVRDHVVCYAIYPPGLKIIYRSPIWRDFGENELKHGVAVSSEGYQYKIEGRPWSEGNDGKPTSNSHYGFIKIDSNTKGLWVLRASDDRHWVNKFDKKEIDFIQ